MVGSPWGAVAAHVQKTQEETQGDIPWFGEMDSWPQKDLIDHIDQAISEFLGEPTEKPESEGC